MQEKNRYAGIDAFRIPAAILVVAIHTSPFAVFSDSADFFLTRVLARIAVPFFFMITGQFVLSDYLTEAWEPFVKIGKYLKKMLVFYGISILLYLPIGIYAGHYKNLTIPLLFKMIVFDGTFYHLWYFPACMVGILLLCLLKRFFTIRGMYAAAGLLYAAGLFGDSYYGLAEKIPAAASIYEAGFSIWSYTRNGLFMAPVFFLCGVYAGRCKSCIGSKKVRKKRFCACLCFAVSFLLMTAEAFTLRYFDMQRHDSMYALLIPVVIFFYQMLLLGPCRKEKDSWMERTVSLVIYIIHPAIIVALRLAAKVSGFSAPAENSLVQFALTAVLSYAAAYVIAVILRRIRQSRERKKQEMLKSRTWVEIDSDALGNNVKFIRNILPENCKLMPAVKANAYGHGDVKIASCLRRMGVDAFCVACVNEGVRLRRAGIGGEILVLGYTHPVQFDLLRRYCLSQTVVDSAYAKQLQLYGKKLHVHIGIDTGMHRLGERWENTEEILQIFRIKNLIVDGIYTHLSADEEKGEANRQFTMSQAAHFSMVLDELKEHGIRQPKVHMQASYGVFNYPALCGDYARVGIALYGVLSTGEDTAEWREALKPVLSLKTRVASVREIYAGETAGYGFSFTAKRTMKIAALSIGYADGFPRMLSNGKGAVLIRGSIAPVVGMVCMDQTLVDVTEIADVCTGDVAVVIGISQEKEISVCDLAQRLGTITNEILSRIGERAERVTINGFRCRN